MPKLVDRRSWDGLATDTRDREPVPHTPDGGAPPARSWRVGVRLLLWGVLLATTVVGPIEAHAQDDAPTVAQDRSDAPLTAEAAADAAIAAHEADEQERLRELAALPDLDPWLIVDQLLLSGAREAAMALAKAGPEFVREALPAYLESVRDVPRPGPLDEALDRIQSKLEAGDVAGALALIPTEGEGIFGVRFARARGELFAASGRHAESAHAFEQAAERASAIGWTHAAAHHRYFAARSYWQQGDRATAVARAQEGLALAEPMGPTKALGDCLNFLGAALSLSGRRAEAVPVLERSVEVQDAIGANPANTLSNLGNAYQALGRLREVIRVQTRVVELMEAEGDAHRVRSACIGLARAHQLLGERVQALGHYERVLELSETPQHRATVPLVQGEIATLLAELGRFDEAVETGERGLALAETTGNMAAMDRCLGALAVARRYQGRLAEALDLGERALRAAEATRNPETVLRALNLVASLQEALGRPETALELLQRAEQLAALGTDPLGKFMIVGNMGAIHEALGRYDEALDAYDAALELAAPLDRPELTIPVHLNRANALRELGRHEDALAGYRHTLERFEAFEGTYHLQRAACHLGMAAVYDQTGRLESAKSGYQEALRLARECGSIPIEIRTLFNLAQHHATLQQPEPVVAHIRQCIELIPLLSRGLADVQGARARERWASMLELGVTGAVLLGDVAEVHFLTESSRAGVLLESLGGRDALAQAVLPEELQAAHRKAADRVQDAEGVLADALSSRKLKAVREARKGLQAARAELVDVLERSQRAAKAQTGVVHPTAASVERVQAALQPGEALLSYVVLESDERPTPGMVALLITPTDSRAVADLPDPSEDAPDAPDDSGGKPRLGLPADLPTDDPRAWAAAVPRLVEQLVAPVALPEGLRRLYVSPDGPLAFVPFGLLFPELDVAYVPSGTVLALLREESTEPGTGVLALGDPDYDAPRGRPPGSDGSAQTTRGAKLAPLPGTRDEAKAVGDVVLLGADANETRLRAALTERPRWRAIHLACHGLVDPESSLLSSLALTPTPTDDGYLMTAEVFRLHAPADMVVLSACETARGDLFRSEGVVGFTHAFTLAGASRVIVSLWKVDDEATRALMTEFYRLWNPAPEAGTKPLPAATALRRAQEHVRSQEPWADPVYWAAWQLWGLGD